MLLRQPLFRINALVAGFKIEPEKDSKVNPRDKNTLLRLSLPQQNRIIPFIIRCSHLEILVQPEAVTNILKNTLKEIRTHSPFVSYSKSYLETSKQTTPLCSLSVTTNRKKNNQATVSYPSHLFSPTLDSSSAFRSNSSNTGDNNGETILRQRRQWPLQPSHSTIYIKGSWGSPPELTTKPEKNGIPFCQLQNVFG